MKLALFLTGFAQVALVAINTWQIANNKIVGALIVGFLISLVWTFNVRRVAFATNMDRIVYCLGASAGTATGLLITHILYK